MRPMVAPGFVRGAVHDDLTDAGRAPELAHDQYERGLE